MWAREGGRERGAGGIWWRALRFLFQQGAIQTLIFSHTWCFLWLGTPDAVHQWGNQRYQAGWRFTERSSTYCLTPTLNIHPHRQIIGRLLDHPSPRAAGVQPVIQLHDIFGAYVDAIPNIVFPFITFRSGWTHQRRAIFCCESTVAARFRGLAESADILGYISRWAKRGCEIVTRENTCMREMERDGQRQNKRGVKCLTYLVASLAMAAKQREVGACRAVFWSVIVQTFWMYPWATHLARKGQ